MGLGIPHSKNSLSLLMVSKYSIEGYMRLRKKILCGGHGYPPSDAYFGRDTETTRLSRERERAIVGKCEACKLAGKTYFNSMKTN
jgi:hypothetical protein